MKSKMIAVVCVLALVLTTGTQQVFGSNYEPSANPGSVAIDAVLVRQTVRQL